MHINTDHAFFVVAADCAPVWLDGYTLINHDFLKLAHYNTALVRISN